MPAKKLKYVCSLVSVSKLCCFASVFAFLVSLYCCTPKLAPPTPVDAERGKVSWDECSIEKLKEGHTLYINKCGSCHALKMPRSENEEGWKKIVPPMAQKAKLNEEEEALILHYLLTMREAKK